MRKPIPVVALFTLLLIISWSCGPRARYERMLKRERASGIRHDSLFMGLYLGMHEKDFYEACWELNRQGLVKQSTNNLAVEYLTRDELRHPATMNFYPEFIEGHISGMPVRFIYNGWTPWNKELSAEKLSEDVLHWYEGVYGKGFIEVAHPTHGKAWTRIDGNRRITIFRGDDAYAWAIFSDLSIDTTAVLPPKHEIDND